MNATITNGVTITADEMTSYPQQIPSICKLKFKISSAEEETLRLISKGKGKNNRSVLLEQRRPDIRVSQRNDRDAVWRGDGVHARLTVLGDLNTHTEDASDLTGAKSALITAVSSPPIPHTKYIHATTPRVRPWMANWHNGANTAP